MIIRLLINIFVVFKLIDFLKYYLKLDNVKTKLQNILETFDEKDISVFKSLVTTKLMDGSDKHMEYLNSILVKDSQYVSNKSNLPIKERLIMSDLFKMAEKYVVIKESLSVVKKQKINICCC